MAAGALDALRVGAGGMVATTLRVGAVVGGGGVAAVVATAIDVDVGAMTEGDKVAVFVAVAGLLVACRIGLGVMLAMLVATATLVATAVIDRLGGTVGAGVGDTVAVAHPDKSNSIALKCIQ